MDHRKVDRIPITKARSRKPVTAYHPDMTSAPEQFLTAGHGGVRIVADRFGDPRARAVVFLHGGGQTRRSWGRAAAGGAPRAAQADTPH